MFCDNCGEPLTSETAVYTTGPESGKPIILCASCDDEDVG